MMPYLLFGSPTVELFVASYNNRANHSNTIPIEVGEYGYVDYAQNIPFQFEENHGIYSKNNNREWWISSPGGENYADRSQIYVSYTSNYSYFSSTSYVDINSIMVRPIVCIRTSLFDSKYTLADE